MIYLMLLILIGQIIILTNVYSISKYIVPMRNFIKQFHEDAIEKITEFRNKKLNKIVRKESMKARKISVYFDIKDVEIIENLLNFKESYTYKKQYEDEWGRIESNKDFVIFRGRPNELNKKEAKDSLRCE